MSAFLEYAGTFNETSPACLASIVEKAPIGIAVLRGPELIYEYVNPYYQALAPSLPLLGQPFGRALWEMPELLARLRRVWATGIPWHAVDLPVKLARESGHEVEQATFTLLCVKIRRRTPPDALTGFVLETTRRVEAERRSLQRAAELEGIIDTMLEGVIVYDRERHVTLINEAGRRLVTEAGVDPDVLENADELANAVQWRLPNGRLIGPADLPSTRALRGESSRTTVQFFNPLTRRPGFLSIGAAPILDANGDGQVVGAVAVGNDITELTELDRLKEEFIRVVAHELKTPITIMKGYAAVLNETLGSKLAPEHVRMLDAIDRNADRLNRLLCELLDAQQIELGSLELVEAPMDLAPLLRDVVDRMDTKVSPKHRVRLTAAPSLSLVADAERLREVMRILLDNAVRYSPAGGDIEVSLAQVDGSAQVSVRDHGVGIPPERCGRIFQRFYRAHTGTPHDYGGTGLGLYVARSIVECHGGSISFESDESSGTTFTFRVPMDRAHGR
jgi:signal transduction histidine kinase